MHETIIASKIIAKAKEHGNVQAISVEVGDLAEIDAHELEDALKKLVKWKVNVSSVRAVIKCKCSYRGEPEIVSRDHDNVVFECPKCKKIPTVVSGQDIVLKEVQVK